MANVDDRDSRRRHALDHRLRLHSVQFENHSLEVPIRSSSPSRTNRSGDQLQQWTLHASADQRAAQPFESSARRDASRRNRTVDASDDDERRPASDRRASRRSVLRGRKAADLQWRSIERSLEQYGHRVGSFETKRLLIRCSLADCFFRLSLITSLSSLWCGTATTMFFLSFVRFIAGHVLSYLSCIHAYFLFQSMFCTDNKDIQFFTDEDRPSCTGLVVDP